MVAFNKNKLRIMFININGITEKTQERLQLATDENIDIIILNENKLTNIRL